MLQTAAHVLDHRQCLESSLDRLGGRVEGRQIGAPQDDLKFPCARDRADADRRRILQHELHALDGARGSTQLLNDFVGAGFPIGCRFQSDDDAPDVAPAPPPNPCPAVDISDSTLRLARTTSVSASCLLTSSGNGVPSGARVLPLMVPCPDSG